MHFANSTGDVCWREAVAHSPTGHTVRFGQAVDNDGPLTHPFQGDALYERNGFRLSNAPSSYDRSGPTLGQDQDWVLDELLGLSPSERAALEADGVFD